MTKFDDFTVTLAIDGKYLPQLLASSLTWRLFHPWLWHRPWLIAYDRETVLDPHLNKLDQHLRYKYPGQFSVEYVPWPPEQVGGYQNQRHKMLSAFAALASEKVETSYWLKIDTDAVCLGDSEGWPDDSWFDGGPAFVAPKWHYTKPPDQMAQLDDWGDTVPELAKFERLNLPVEPGSNKCKHSRMCSWLSFYHTGWTRQFASYCERYRLPVASQDGSMWYVAARRKDFFRIVSMKDHRWTNISRLPALEQKVREVLLSQRQASKT